MVMLYPLRGVYCKYNISILKCNFLFSCAEKCYYVKKGIQAYFNNLNRVTQKLFKMRQQTSLQRIEFLKHIYNPTLMG